MHGRDRDMYGHENENSLKLNQNILRTKPMKKNVELQNTWHELQYDTITIENRKNQLTELISHTLKPKENIFHQI